MKNAAILIALVALLAGACESDDDADTVSDTTTEEADAEPTEPEDGDDAEPGDGEALGTHESGCEFVEEARVRVTPDCVDAEWPLTVEEGEVYCTEGSAALLRVPVGQVGGGIYALNGSASTRFPDLPPLEDVWLENPEIEGTRVNIGPLTDIALALC